MEDNPNPKGGGSHIPLTSCSCDRSSHKEISEAAAPVLATTDSHHVQQVVSRVIHLELGELIDSNRREVSFISPPVSCEKLKSMCAPIEIASK